ncbi:MAG: hypothetical protein RLZZ385_34 [Pseudomonadota bacterium]
MNERFSGVLAPVVTPFDPQYEPDNRRWLAHCHWLLERGVSLAVFGTNSEANSLAVSEKLNLLDRLAEDGIEGRYLMPGTGSCALPDAVALTRHAVHTGCRAVLMLPPFYYRSVDVDGLFGFYAEVIEQVADERLQLYLYNIPSHTGVPIPLPLVERLAHRYPAVLAGIKDSSGDWQTTLGYLRCGVEDFRVFCGSESFLLATLREGGAGCISATANVNPVAIHALYRAYRETEADSLQAALEPVRRMYQQLPMIAALKFTLADHWQDTHWQRVRPPLTPLNKTQQQQLVQQLAVRNPMDNPPVIR